MLSSIFDTCVPRPEIRSGRLPLDVFAAKLRSVVEGTAQPVYGDPKLFFENTFPTDGLRTLITEVFGRLSGKTIGSPIIRLETSFGGGKTHDEIALWHIARQGRNIDGLHRFVNDLSIIPERPVQVAAIDGRDLDSKAGINHPTVGLTTHTMWGEIAYQIRGIDGYELLRGSDQSLISPGTSVLERLVQGQPTIIMLDEIARHLRSAKATAVLESTLAKQVVAFLFSLMDFAASCDHVVFVYSLASETDTFAEETTELQEILRASARQERILSPSSDLEIYNIVRQRLFTSIEDNAAQKAAETYVQAYKSSRDLPSSAKEASYATAIANSYPFHPELFNLLTNKIASIPEFQRTRGALRLLASLVSYIWKYQADHPRDYPLIHPHHVPVGIDEEITNDLTSRLQREFMRLPIKADIYNINGREAYAQRQDQDWRDAGKPPFSSWVSRTIFLHSLTQGISSGIRKSELYLSLLMPGIDLNFADRALDQLVSVAWHLDVDPITTIARFKEEPSINKIIAEEKELVTEVEAKDDLRQRRDSIFAKKFFELVINPEGGHDVSDDPKTIALCLIDFNEETIRATDDPPPPLIKKIFDETGSAGQFRRFQNRLLFLLANRQEIARAVDLAKEYKAIQNIVASASRLEELSDNQRKQLKAQKNKMDLEVRIALTNAYRHLFYPQRDPVKAPKGLMHYPLPLQDASLVKGNQQDVILKVLKDCDKIRSEDRPAFAPGFILQKVWPQGLDRWTTKALREKFAQDIGLNLLLDAEVAKLRDTIRQGFVSGEWDIKLGDRVFMKLDDAPAPSLPEMIEFSDQFELYRRGVLEPPKPRELELSVQVSAAGEVRSVEVRWRARGAQRVTLYEGNQAIALDRMLLAADTYTGEITQTTPYRLVADYGSGEIIEKTVIAAVYAPGELPPPSLKDGGTGYGLQVNLLEKPTKWTVSGTPNKTFADLQDWLLDRKRGGMSGVRQLKLTVSDSVTDYRRLGTTLSLLSRYNLTIDQAVTIQTATQTVGFTYDGELRGFQPFFNLINGLLNQSEVQADVSMTLIFTFDRLLEVEGSELKTLQQTLTRNPVDRLSLTVTVEY